MKNIVSKLVVLPNIFPIGGGIPIPEPKGV